MCSTRSHGVGHGGGLAARSEDEQGQARIAAGDVAGAPGRRRRERPMDRHSAAIWSMRATCCFEVRVGMGGSLSPGTSPDCSHHGAGGARCPGKLATVPGRR